ncbi:MAG: DUF3037 domain-containing protein [Paeniclostridium sordellii]|nr:DUF3037 domain-containing protein [Paeniclostridium sordellii]
MINVDYSVLCHYPSIVSKDCLTLGIIFYDRSNNIGDFKTIKKWDRAKAFNDSLDIEMIKFQLESIQDEVRSFAQEKNFDLAKYTKFYVNELKFTEVIKVSIDESFEEFMELCVRQYMPLDLDKDKRPNKEEQTQFVKKMMKISNIEYTQGTIKGSFDENINFDFIIKDYAFKIFRFEGREENRVINNVKSWAYNCIELKDSYKVIAIIDLDTLEENYKSIYQILNKESDKIIHFNELISFTKTL